MTDLAVSISEDNVMTTLGAFLDLYVSCEVIQAQVNRVSMPSNGTTEFVTMTQKSMKQLSKPADFNNSTEKTILTKFQFTVQLDFYGEKGVDRASSIAALLRDESGADFFDASGYDMQTLYAGDAHQMPLITGEQQYLARWTMDTVFQINQIITLPIETANTITVDIINVNAAFPA